MQTKINTNKIAQESTGLNASFGRKHAGGYEIRNTEESVKPRAKVS